MVAELLQDCLPFKVSLEHHWFSLLQVTLEIHILSSFFLLEENMDVMKTTDNERKVQTVENCSSNSFLVGSDKQRTSDIPVYQSTSSENVKQQDRLLQNVASRESKNSRGTTQSNTYFEFQVMKRIRGLDQCKKGIL